MVDKLAATLGGAPVRPRAPVARILLRAADRERGALGGARGGGVEARLMAREAHVHPLRRTRVP